MVDIFSYSNTVGSEGGAVCVRVVEGGACATHGARVTTETTMHGAPRHRGFQRTSGKEERRAEYTRVAKGGARATVGARATTEVIPHDAPRRSIAVLSAFDV